MPDAAPWGDDNRVVVERWWLRAAALLRAEHRLVAFALLGMTQAMDRVVDHPTLGTIVVPRGSLVSTQEEIASEADVTRAVARRAIENLEKKHMVHVEAAVSLGNTVGFSFIFVNGVDVLRPLDSIPTPFELAKGRGYFKIGDSQGVSQGDRSKSHTESVTCNADPGAVSQGVSPGPRNLTAPPAVAVDRVHPRSPDPEEISEISSRTEGTEEITSPKSKRGKARAPKPPLLSEATHPRAYVGADYLRSRILQAQPSNLLARRPWGGENGDRAKWADHLRLMVDRDGRDWDEIAKTVKWLFDNPRDHRFVVMSTEALRKKWDNIQLAIQRAKQDAETALQPRHAPAHPDAPERKWRVLTTPGSGS